MGETAASGALKGERAEDEGEAGVATTSGDELGTAEPISRYGSI